MDIHEDPLSAWNHLRLKGGLELDDRDEGLDERIRDFLDPTAPRIEDALKSAKMEDFVRAFFNSLHPYVSMFRDILDFFEHAEATRGESQWVLRLDDVDLNLEHFRTWLENWEGISKGAIQVPAIDGYGVWSFYRVLQEQPSVEEQIQASFGRGVLEVAPDVRHWVAEHNQGRYRPLPSSLSPGDCPEELSSCASILSALLGVLLGYGLTRDALMKIYRDNASSENRKQGSPDDGYDFWNIAQHETDFCIRTLMVALAAAARLPNEDLSSLGDKLNSITDMLPVRSLGGVVSIGGLESILSLPLWEKRFDLYAVWISTQIVTTLTKEGHDVEIHHDKGCIPFKFRETVVATVHSSMGPFRLVAERKIALVNPQGKGRIANVQPDYGLWTKEGGMEVCKLIVEVKHYKKAARSKFVDVYLDYANAVPGGIVGLVNHGPMGNSIYDLPRAIQNRCFAIGHLTSSNLKAKQEFAERIRECVGGPIPAWPTGRESLNSDRVLLFDVSGSMRSIMRSSAMLAFVRQLSADELPSKLVAADDKIVAFMENSEEGFVELLGLDGGNTDLQHPLAELLTRYELAIVVTDAEGAGTIKGVCATPHVQQSSAPAGIVVYVCRNE